MEAQETQSPPAIAAAKAAPLSPPSSPGAQCPEKDGSDAPVAASGRSSSKNGSNGNNHSNPSTQDSRPPPSTHRPPSTVRVKPPPPPPPSIRQRQEQQQPHQQQRPETTHLVRHASSEDDDDSLAAEPPERFEDEPAPPPPDETTTTTTTASTLTLPKPSPTRRAARRQRRKSGPRPRYTAASTTKASAVASSGLPKLRMFQNKESQTTLGVTASPSRVDDDASSHWSSSDGDDYLDGDEDETNHNTTSTATRRRGAKRRQPFLSPDDIEICQRLDEEYERALEEREVVYTARYNSVRQSACFSIFFMLLYLTLGTMFFMRQANWTVSESILFSIYTITTVGYGHLETPDSPAFQLYVIFFIFIGIAGITLMVAQTYQYIALVASRAEHAREQTQLARIRDQDRRRLHSPGMGAVATSDTDSTNGGGGPDATGASSTRMGQQMMVEMNIPLDWIDRFFRCVDQTRIFLSTTELGRSISVVLPFLGLILAGAMVVGPIEGWTLTESLYFAVVSLTTVGFGDYAPTHDSSILFCIIWLPCSIYFMSLYLTNVAAFYIRLSDKNIERIEEQLRRRVKLAKEVARKERAAARRRALRGQAMESSVPAGSADGADDQEGDTNGGTSRGDAKSVDSDTMEQSSKDDGEEEDVHLFGSPDQEGEEVATRREKILMNFRGQWERDDGAESDGSGESLIRKGRGLATMKDMLRAVHANMPKGSARVFQSHGPEQEILSLRSNRFMDSHSLRQGSLRKPSFALRALVQERFAEIIAAEVAGFESGIEIKENTLSVTIGTLRQTTSKWMVPRRARRAFRAVAFEALYFVGEHGLITRGADALFDLSPMEFHRLFTPLLAALGDADSMEAWLATTDVLADVDLNRSATAVPASASPTEMQDVPLDYSSS